MCYTGTTLQAVCIQSLVCQHGFSAQQVAGLKLASLFLVKRRPQVRRRKVRTVTRTVTEQRLSSADKLLTPQPGPQPLNVRRILPKPPPASAQADCPPLPPLLGSITAPPLHHRAEPPYQHPQPPQPVLVPPTLSPANTRTTEAISAPIPSVTTLQPQPAVISLQPPDSSRLSTEDLLRPRLVTASPDLLTSTVASPNLYISSDRSVLVDTELGLARDLGQEEGGQEDRELVARLCVHDDNYIPYSRFRKCTDSDEDFEDEAKRDEEEEHKDHSYIGRLTELDLLDLYYDFDLKISDETLQRMINLTKHLYEDEDDTIEIFG